MSFVTFITPTEGKRPDSLRRVWSSLLAQTDPDWSHVVVLDYGFDEKVENFDTKIVDRRLLCVSNAKPFKSAGLSRNLGIAVTDVSHEPEWIAFVDDDDAVTPDYVQKLRKYPKNDIVVFRMDDPKLGILPDLSNPVLEWGQVGISFAIKADFIRKNNLRFIKENLSLPGGSGNEDIAFLKSAQEKGADIEISDHLTYIVRPVND